MWGCNDFSDFIWVPGFLPCGSIGLVLWLLIWCVTIAMIITVAIKLFRVLNTERHAGFRDRYDSLNILKLRFAKGQITQEEYHRMKDTLLEA